MSTYAERAKQYRITTVLFHRDDDRRIIDWLDRQRPAEQSAAIRQAIYFYLDRQDRNGHTPGSPPSEGGVGGGFDPETIRQALEITLRDHLADIRQVVQSVLDNALISPLISPLPLGRPQGGQSEGPGVRDDEIAGLLDRLDLALEVDTP